MTKIIFVLIDGLDVASTAHMSYLAAHKENAGSCDMLGGMLGGVMNCELPTVSKPIYASIFTGKTPLSTCVTHNKNTFMQSEVYSESFFMKMHKANKNCAVAAYYWMRELYTNEVYDKSNHRLTLNHNGPIAHGLFYDDDFYADKYVFQDAEALRINCKPDFLLVHSMGVDAAGHKFGANSLEYRNAVRDVDVLLAEYAPTWLDAGAMLIITSDHGMHADGAHNDLTPNVRQVPYWILGASQTQIYAPTKQTDWYNLLCNYFFGV